jgi:hypothetical protein
LLHDVVVYDRLFACKAGRVSETLLRVNGRSTLAAWFVSCDGLFGLGVAALALRCYGTWRDLWRWQAAVLPAAHVRCRALAKQLIHSNSGDDAAEHVLARTTSGVLPLCCELRLDSVCRIEGVVLMRCAFEA